MPRTKQTGRRSKKPELKHEGPKFTLFPNLPMEIQVIVWKLTLEPRVVEVFRHRNSSFGALVNNPPALEVCRDSRAAVISSYPLSFGTYFFPPSTRFNFLMDTIYLDYHNHEDIGLFFAILSQYELSSIRYLALDMSLFVDDDHLSSGDNGTYQETLLNGLERVVNDLSGLEQLIEVHDVRIWGEHCVWSPDKESHRGRKRDVIEFVEELPVDFQKPELLINPNLPGSSYDFKTWGIRNHKVAFGVRKSYTVARYDPEPITRWYHRRYCYGVFGGRFMGDDTDD